MLNQPKQKLSKLEKTIETWIIKQYIYSIKTQDKRRLNKQSNCINFLLKFYGKNPQEKEGIKLISMTKYKKIKNHYKTKLARVQKHKGLNELQRKYPNIDIISAYKVAVLRNKLKLTKTDIECFEENIEILSKILIKNKKTMP